MNSSNDDVLLDIEKEPSLSMVQDSIHLSLKIKHRMQRCSIVMPMGNKQVSSGHLKILIDEVPKDVHGLVRSDILNQYVADSEATVMYLKINKQISSSFMELDIDAEERIFRMWHALYFLRAWKKWLLKQKRYDDASQLTPDENFISDNAFACTELNAYGLLNLITKFRDANTPHLFLPSIFQSQACERTFRQLRSMTTINWTRINFSLLELIQIADRIELQNRIVYFELADKDVNFPRAREVSQKKQLCSLPSNEKIREILQKAQNAALSDAAKIGMCLEVSDVIRRKLRKGQMVETKRNESNEHSNNGIDGELNESDFMFSNLKDYSRPERENHVDLDSRFVQVFDEDGNVKSALKSSLIWALSESKGVLSNDRLRRVQGQSGIPVKRNVTKRRVEASPLPKRKKLSIGIREEKEIRVGEWCFFKRNKKTSEGENFGENIVFGAMLGFRYIGEKNEREKKYMFDYAFVSCNDDCEKHLKVLATWYKYGSEKILEAFSENNNFYIDIDNYIGTADAPIIIRDPNTNLASYELQNHSESKDILFRLYEKHRL